MPETTPPNQIDPLFLGIDVGGTDVKLGLVDPSGVVVHRDRVSTPSLGTPQRVFEYAMTYATDALRALELSPSTLASVGLAVPGVLDSREFVLREVVNLPGWLGVSLLKELQSASKIPSVVVNDANSAAFAEHAMRNLGNQSLALVTLGTGVGCGVVFGGNPHGGDHGCAGELGHVAVEFGKQALPCTCGSRGHLETYAGAGGVVRRFRAAIAEIDSPPVPDDLRGEEITPREIAAAAEQGNEVCQKIVHETAEYVGRAIGFIGQVADPAVVLLGGAMTFGGDSTETGRDFLRRVRESVRQTTLVQVGGNMKIDFAKLGNDAGMLGAAILAKQRA